MSLATQLVTVAVALSAVAASASLWLGARRREGSTRRAYRWFSAAAVLWGAGVVLGQVLAVPVATAVVPMSFADLPALLALPMMAAGLTSLAAVGREGGGGGAPASRGHRLERAADGYVFASAIFLVGWVTVFDSAFVRAAAGAGTFAVDLIHPLADLAALGALLPVAGRAGSRAVMPYLALLAMSVSDSLAVGARITGRSPSVGALVVALAGLAVLGYAPAARWSGGPGVTWRGAPLPGAALGQRAPEPHRGGGRGGGEDAPAAPGTPGDREAAGHATHAGQSGTTTAAAAAAGVAALAISVRALVGGHLTWPVVVAVAGTTVFALAVRVSGLVRRERSAARIWRDQSWQFRQLADRTSDVVMLCNLDGVITYASRAVAGYGYTPEHLRGRTLVELVHPEDRSGGTRAVRRAVTDATGRAGRYPCRVRAADGTWRHVESTLSLYHDPGGPDRLLVTARDMSDQVALRRQVTHLTFHDGLTGLPNRTYVEQRARGVLSQGAQASPEEPGRAPVTGVIFLDLDGFAAVNDAAGHGAGDLLLAQVAHRLRAAVPPRDTVARWGGDEFAVLVGGAVSSEEIVDIARALARTVASAPFRAGERNVSLTASVGVALSDDAPAGFVWRNADMAMSRAKELGGDRVEVFSLSGADEDQGTLAPPVAARAETGDPGGGGAGAAPTCVGGGAGGGAGGRSPEPGGAAGAPEVAGSAGAAAGTGTGGAGGSGRGGAAGGAFGGAHAAPG